jgi:predicted ABC-type ATPase
LHIRREVNREFEQFVNDCISAGCSFSMETTLRSQVTFEQARLARSLGFNGFMIYVALDGFDRHLERVKRRASRGGHAASESTLRRIHESSMANLPIALDPAQSGVGEVRVFDNSRDEQTPRLALEVRQGRILHVSDEFPAWLQSALNWTVLDLQQARLSPHAGFGQ